MKNFNMKTKYEIRDFSSKLTGKFLFVDGLMDDVDGYHVISKNDNFKIYKNTSHFPNNDCEFINIGNLEFVWAKDNRS